MDSKSTWEILYSPCELCEKESHLYLECVDCKLIICKNCKLIHAKVPALAKHTIVDMRGRLSKHKFDDVKFNSISCDDHPMIVSKYCVKCDKLVCPACISTDHTKHTLEELKVAGSRKFQDLILFDAYVKFCTKKLKKETENLDVKKERWECHVASVKKLVDENEQMLVEAIRNYAEEMRQTIDQKKQARIDLIDSKKVDNLTKEAALQTFSKLVEQTIGTDEGEIIFQASVEQKRLSPYLQDFSVPDETLDILPPNISKNMLTQIFGTLKHESIPNRVTLDHISNSSVRNCCGIDRLAMCSDGSTWFSMYDPDEEESYLKKENLDSFFSKSKILKINAFDMAISRDDTLFVSVHPTPEVMKISKTGKAELFVDVSPLIARGIHVTKHNEVLIGVRDTGSPYEVATESSRKIMIFDINGQKKDELEFDDNKKFLVTIPARISTAINGDVLVCDGISKRHSVVKSIGRRTREIKWTFRGGVHQQKSESFKADDVVCSDEGLIVVAECNAHRIYVLSIEGDVLAFKDVTALEWKMMLPTALSFDQKGFLWIGCGTHFIKKELKGEQCDNLPVYSCVDISAV